MMSAAAVRIPPARCKEAAGLGCMIGRTKEPFGVFEHLAKTTLRIRWLDSQNVLRGSPRRVVFAKVPRFEGGLRQGSRCRSSANVGSYQAPLLLFGCRCDARSCCDRNNNTASLLRYSCCGTHPTPLETGSATSAPAAASHERVTCVFNPPPTVTATRSNGGDVVLKNGRCGATARSGWRCGRRGGASAMRSGATP